MTTLPPALATLIQIETELRTGLFERDEAIRAALVAIIGRSHLVLLGPPGTAKSDLIKQISERFCDPTGQGLNYFVYLLTRFTTPEELFGPVSVHGLKNDTYERITTHKLPKAQIAFLDEIFKSSSAVLNILLTILNERVFDNGTQRQPVPLITLFGASNEMPQEASDLEALWDRFLLRLEVGYLAESNFEKLLQMQVQGQQTPPAPLTIMSQTELVALQQFAAAIPIPPSVTNALVTLRRDLSQQKGIIASDRRWVQCLRVLQAHALLEGRDVVEEDDLAILSYALWNQPEQKNDITRMVAKLANPLNAKASELKDTALAVWSEAKAKMDANSADEQATLRATIAVEAISKLKKIESQLVVLKKQIVEQNRPTKRVDQAMSVVKTSKQAAMEGSGL